MSNSLQSHELQNAKPPCPSPTSRDHSNSRPSRRCCDPAISSSVIPFSSSRGSFQPRDWIQVSCIAGRFFTVWDIREAQPSWTVRHIRTISVRWSLSPSRVLVASQFSSVQSLSRVQLFATPWISACQASPSPTPGAYPNSCLLSWWCHLTISSSVVPFSTALNLSQH